MSVVLWVIVVAVVLGIVVRPVAWFDSGCAGELCGEVRRSPYVPAADSGCEGRGRSPGPVLGNGP